MKLIFDPDARFECSGCAKCCKTPWKVEVDRVTLDRYKGSILELRVKQELGKPPLVRTHDGKIVAAKEEGRCVLLGKDNECRFHYNLGEHFKPATCRLFPFILTPTPDGIVVGVSHYCNSVQKGEGRPLETYQEELEEQLAGFDSVPIAETRIRVAKDRSLEWAEYLHFESQLLTRLATLPAEEVLVSAFEGLSEWVEDATLEQPPLTGTRPRVDLSAVEQLARATSGAPYPDSDPDWLTEGIKAYLQHVIFRKQLVAQPPLLETLAKLLVCPRILRLSAGTTPTLEGFRAGLDKIEMALVHQQGEELFGTQEIAALVSLP